METALKWMIAVGGGITSFLFGGWSYLLWVLLFFVVVDFLTGTVLAIKTGQLSSRVGFIGGYRKLMVFFFVAIGHMVDNALASEIGGIFAKGDAFRDGVTFFYLYIELLSITENAERLGVPVPEPIRRALQVLNEKAQGGGGE